MAIIDAVMLIPFFLLTQKKYSKAAYIVFQILYWFMAAMNGIIIAAMISAKPIQTVAVVLGGIGLAIDVMCLILLRKAHKMYLTSNATEQMPENPRKDFSPASETAVVVENTQVHDAAAATDTPVDPEIEKLYKEWPRIKEIEIELLPEERERYISGLLSMSEKERADHIKSVEESLSGQYKKWPLLAIMNAKDRNNTIIRMEHKLRNQEFEESYAEHNTFPKIAALILLVPILGLVYLLYFHFELPFFSTLVIFAIILIPAIIVLLRIQKKSAGKKHEKWQASFTAEEQQALDFLKSPEYKQWQQNTIVRRTNYYSNSIMNNESLITSSNTKNKSGTKTIVKNAVVGYIIGGPAGGIIGAIVGKDKVDAKRANR